MLLLLLLLHDITLWWTFWKITRFNTVEIYSLEIVACDSFSALYYQRFNVLQIDQTRFQPINAYQTYDCRFFILLISVIDERS